MEDVHQALLVGSVGLENEEQVFRAAAETLGTSLKRIPDGETGPRFAWVGWQQHVFEQTPQLELVEAAPVLHERLDEDYEEQSGAAQPRFKLRDGKTPEDVDFGSLGYADEALASYAVFKGLRDEGVIVPGTRFQVSMGTPVASTMAFLAPDNFAELEPVYETAQMAELQRMLDGIPHEDLAIQWDICVEVWMTEGWIPSPLSREDLVERIVRVSEAVPGDVELGYHMCYGDLGGHHLQEPDDTQALVDLMNPVFEKLSRPLQWWHFPVPVARDDEKYFAPLRGLRLPEGTEVYAGVVHVDDGEEGARRRLAAAQTAIDVSGVATECGMGRKYPAEQVQTLLDIHAGLSGVNV